MTCGSCDYWQPLWPRADHARELDPGGCRRHAPRNTDEGYAMWPVTSAADWCGDYQRHPTRRLQEPA